MPSRRHDESLPHAPIVQGSGRLPSHPLRGAQNGLHRVIIDHGPAQTDTFLELVCSQRRRKIRIVEEGEHAGGRASIHRGMHLVRPRSNPAGAHVRPATAAIAVVISVTAMISVSVSVSVGAIGTRLECPSFVLQVFASEDLNLVLAAAGGVVQHPGRHAFPSTTLLKVNVTSNLEWNSNLSSGEWPSLDHCTSFIFNLVLAVVRGARDLRRVWKTEPQSLFDAGLSSLLIGWH